MKTNFQKIIKKIFLTSLGTLGVSQATEAITIENNISEANGNGLQLKENKENDLSQKFVLKFGGDNSYLIAGHRSHRSHQSHRSHYSSSSGGSSSSSRSKSSSSGTSSSVRNNNSASGTSGYTLPAQNKVYKLGDRILKRGMRGHDVTELLNILVAKKYIIPKEGTEQIATGEFEFTELIEDSVKKFQEDCALTCDGIVGTTTVYHLKK